MELPEAPKPLPQPPKPLLPPAPRPVVFKKSRIILFLAYLQIVFFLLSFFSNNLISYGGYVSPLGFIGLIPSVLIILAKNESTYKIWKFILIAIYVIGIIVPFFLGVLLFKSHW